MTNEREREREHEREQAGSAERLAAIAAARDVAIMLALIGGAIAMAITSHNDLAFVMAGGALTYAVPTAAGKLPAPSSRLIPPQVVALAVGVGACALVSGCAGGTITPWKVASGACETVRVAALACQLLPDEPTSGGEASP